MPASTARGFRRYPWPRFWTERRRAPTEGFYDPLEASAVRLDERSTDEPCLVLLGEPGLGKTYAVKEAASLAADVGFLVHRIDLGAYDEGASLIGAIVDAPEWRGWLDSSATMHLYLDGFDEALLHIRAINKRLLATLEQLDRAHRARLRLRISCRSAEWIHDFGNALGELLDAEPVVLHLAPLREADARVAAKIDGLDADAFVDEIEAKDIGRLAATPLTLRMLLDAAAEGGLPETRAELFERASIRLLEEHDAERRRETAASTLHAGQRLAVAERISAAILLSGRAAVTVDAANGSRGDVRIREIAGFVEQDPDAAGDAFFEVGPDELAEVVGTAFFVSIRGGRYTFWHRVLGEFLAAQYLLHHEMELEQVLSLLVSADDPDRRLIPQLREVSAWVAAGDNRVLDQVVARDPDVLLRADSLALTDSVRRQVVAALLTDATAHRVDRWDTRMRAAYRALLHPGLGGQLRDALARDQSFEVRQAALTLAQACQLPELQPDLIALALDPSEPWYLRDDAVWALKDYADTSARQALVPLATRRIADDEDDEIKGQALEATFPSILDVPAVLSVLTPPRNPHLIGIYSMFANGFVNAVTPADLPAVLEWAAKLTDDKDKDEDEDEDDRLLTRIVDRALVIAWDHLSDPVVLDRVVEIVLPRVDLHADLIDGDDELVFRDANGRCRLVARIVEKHAAELDRVGMLPFTSPPLVTTDDVPWLLERTRETAGSAQEVAWASLASRVFVPELGNVTSVLALAEQSNAVRDAFAGWLTPVELDSDIAKHFTARAARRRAADPRDREDPVDRVDREVVEQLEAFDAGDLDGWWRLNYALAGGRHRDELQADLMALPAWDRAPESVRSRIIAGARVYLEGRDPEPEAWFATNTVNRPAFAGYRALRLLAARRPDEFMALSDSTWERWMPIVVHYPRATGIADDSPDDLVVATAASRLAKAMIPWVLRAIDAQNANGEGHLVVLYRLRAAKARDLLDALAAKVGDSHLTPRARADLVEHLLSSDPPSGIVAAAPYITVEAAAADTATAVTVGSMALAQAPTEAWPLLEPLFTADPLAGVSIIDNVAHGERTDLGAQLDDDALTRLVAWIFTHIPPENDPAPIPGAHRMSPRDSSRRLRDRLAQILAQRGTDVAVTAIEALASRHPVPSLEWRLREAREARLARWTGPEPAHVVQLAQASDARIVLSAEHLQLAVLASLRRIAKHLRAGDPPAAREMWEPTDPPRPKSEEALSTWVAAKLDADMRVGGRLVGRELQIRENRTGKGRGESIDIVVATPLGARVAGAPLASVLIEVKGTWHPQLKTALSDQLANRYLSASTRHGIYLVFWFDRTGWDTRDWRRGNWTKDLAATTELFETQARDVTSTGNVVVRAFVMDGTADDRPAT